MQCKETMENNDSDALYSSLEWWQRDLEAIAVKVSVRAKKLRIESKFPFVVTYGLNRK